jgi:phosphatidylglycerol:prolipoprotein diacylglycerol transferase
VYPVLFRIGQFEISSFGAAMAVGFLAAGWLAARAFPRYRLPADAAWRLLTWAMIGGVLGSKLWFVGEQIARDPDAWTRVFSLGGPLLSRGGITWYGGLIGGALAVLAVAWRAGIAPGPLTDATAPALAVGQGIGRIGCFLVGDDWGVETTLPWGVAFPEGVEPTLVPVHPTQLYEMAWLFALGAWLWRRLGASPSTFGQYLFFAGLGRLWIEALRHNPVWIAGLTNAQVTAVVCMAIGAVIWLRARAVRVTKDAPA